MIKSLRCSSQMSTCQAYRELIGVALCFRRLRRGTFSEGRDRVSAGVFSAAAVGVAAVGLSVGAAPTFCSVLALPARVVCSNKISLFVLVLVPLTIRLPSIHPPLPV